MEEVSKELLFWISAVSSIVSLLSLTGNFIQYATRKSQTSALKAHSQESYNHFFAIARCATKLRAREDAKDETSVKDYQLVLERINGIADAARSSIIAHARHNLGFAPTYEHPAHPGEEQPQQVRLGLLTPDQYALQQGRVG